MSVEIDDLIRDIQLKGDLPNGEFTYSSWEQVFSFMYKISISDEIFYLKKVKSRTGFSMEALRAKLLREFNALEFIYPYFLKYPFYNTPKVIHFSSETLTLMTKGLDGVALSHHTEQYAKNRSNASNTRHALEQTGHFLKELHASKKAPYTVDDLSHLINYIKERLFIGFFTKKQEDFLADYLESTRVLLTQNLGDYKKNNIHCDYFTTNILVTKNDINVIDFGEFKLDHLFFDVIYFRLMIRRQLNNPFKYHRKASQELFEYFCNGYELDYNHIVKDPLFKLYYLKVLSIFISSLIQPKQNQGLKDIISKKLELMSYKKQILNLIKN